MYKNLSNALNRSSAMFSSGIFLSRVTGCIRDIAMAYYFGTSASIAAFLVAYRFANLFRRLFGEIPLTSSFIPQFEKQRAISPKKSAIYFCEFFISLSIILCIVIGISETGLYSIGKTKLFSSDIKNIFSLAMIMLPGLFFICLFGLNSALLQCENRFFLVGASPVIFNCIWILGVVITNKVTPNHATLFLSFTLLLAFLFQWMTTFPKTFKFLKQHLTFSDVKTIKPFGVEIKKAFNPFMLGILGMGASQLNNFLDAFFARVASPEGPAYLWYAVRLQQLPFALFAIAIASAMLPPLSRLFKEGNIEGYISLIRSSIKKAFILLIFATLALIVLGSPIINILFFRGNFTNLSHLFTTRCLWGYSLGLIPAGFSLILASAFYAKGDYKTPAIATGISVIANITLNFTMVGVLRWGAFSITIATTLSALVNFLCLYYKFNKSVKNLFDISLKRLFLKISVSGLFASIATLTICKRFYMDASLNLFLNRQDFYLPNHFPYKLMQLISGSGIYIITFICFAIILKCMRLKDILSLSKR